MELPACHGTNQLVLGLASVLGLIGGAYLLQCGAQHIVSKIVDKKPKKGDANEEQLNSCIVCCADLDLSSAKNYVTCCTCGKHACRNVKCADWRPKVAQWECELCHSSKQSLEHTCSWVAEQMSFNRQKFVYPLRARSEIYIPISADIADGSMHFESVSQIGANSVAIMSGDERSRIREYVEEIVSEMLGGNLDHIKVGQLSKSENYLPTIVNGHQNSNNSSINNNNNNNEQLGDMSQTRLRSLIESIIAETLRNGANNLMVPSGAVSEISLDTRSNGQLSGYGNGAGGKPRRHRTEHYFEPKIYQDLLATAVLNKIADKEGNTRLISESTPDLSAHNIDENYNAEALSTTSGSSIEPRSDSSLTDHELVLNSSKGDGIGGVQLDLERESVLSDYIAAHMVPLPDFSASVTESEDDVVSMSSSMIGDGTWEDNWLFKKKRSTLQSSGTPSSIGMLVPAPKENVRAQIGDRTADEVSDLSEMGSDAEESSLDLLRCTELNDRLLSKHLIGGQNTKLVLDELVDRTSLTSNTLPADNEPIFTETTNPLVTQPAAASTATAGHEKPKATSFGAPPPPMTFQDEEANEEPIQKLIADQLSSGSGHSQGSVPSTSHETFYGDADSVQDSDSIRDEGLDKAVSPASGCISVGASAANTNPTNNTNTNTNTNTKSSTQSNTNTSRTRPHGKLTNGSLRWPSKSAPTLNGGQQNGIHKDDNNNIDIDIDIDNANDVDLVDDDDVVLLRRFAPGSIAEREVKKWYNAVEMPNNPYAPEALKQRISGTQERFMDVPNISPSAEQKALALMTNAAAVEDDSKTACRVEDYKRYSRDYYINNATTPTTPTSTRTASLGGSACSSMEPTSVQTDDEIVINEVNQPHGRISSTAQSNAADLSHWTLSTPVRRSSSLKFINNRNSPTLTAFGSGCSAAERPSTSASHYRDSGLVIDPDVDDFDVRSHRSWRSSTGHSPFGSTLPKRHTQSTLSLHSNGSGMSFASSASKRRQGGGPSAAVLTQFEKQLLHKDLKRNSFRAVSATSKDFVMNPLFESELQATKTSTDDQDSGVDSCLNGFSGIDAKHSNNSLLF